MSEKNHADHDVLNISEEAVAKQQSEQQTEQMPINMKDYEVLQAELAAQQARADQQWDLAIRAKAEMENIRRRAERDVESAHKYGTEKLLAALLPVLDGLEQGLANVNEADEATKAVREGMVLTQKMLADVLTKFGVVELMPAGELFDPNHHEAMSMMENQDVKPNTILHVVQKGYKLHERLLRPARVIVSKAPVATNHNETT